MDKVPLNGEFVRVSSELFAITADVQMVLGNIKKDDYSCDTPDGAGKSKLDCMRRLSRIICGDLNMLSQSDIEKIASTSTKNKLKR